MLGIGPAKTLQLPAVDACLHLSRLGPGIKEVRCRLAQHILSRWLYLCGRGDASVQEGLGQLRSGAAGGPERLPELLQLAAADLTLQTLQVLACKPSEL